MTRASTPPARSRIALALLAVYLFWGSSYLFSRIGVRALPALLFGGARFTMAGVIMLSIAAVARQRVRPARSEWRDLSVLALIGFVICNGAGVWSLQYIASNQGALLNTTAPCWIALLGMLGSRAHRPGRRAIVGLVLGFAGAVLIVRPGGGTQPGGLLPQLVAVGGCFAWAVASIYLRNSRLRLPLLSLIGWQMLLGGIGLLLAGAASGELPRWHWSATGVIALTVQVALASCIAHTAYAWLTRRVTPTVLGTYGYVNPVVATVLGWLWLGETLSANQLAGMALALAGVVLITWRPRGIMAGEP